MTLLGPLRDATVAQTADVGEWLVVFKKNAPVDMFAPGDRLWKGLQVPFFGSKVASLNTSPQSQLVTVENVVTLDGFYIRELCFEFLFKLVPDHDGGKREILRLIQTQGFGFDQTVVTRLKNCASQLIAASVSKVGARRVQDFGPLEVVFPRGVADLGCDEFEVTSVSLHRWSQSEFVNEILNESQADRVRDATFNDRAKKIEWEASLKRLQSNREQQLRIEKALADNDIAAIELERWVSQADALDVDPVVIAIPDQWQQVSAQNAELAARLVESTQFYPLLRSRPDLLRGLESRLTKGPGITNAQSLSLDHLNPTRALHDPQATRLSQEQFSQASQVAAFHRDNLIEKVWVGSGGTSDNLLGCARAVSVSAGVALLVVEDDRDIPLNLKEHARSELGRGSPGKRFGIFVVQATSPAEFFSRSCERVFGISGVTASLEFRSVRGRPELLVRLAGDSDAAETVHRRVTDPSMPLLAAIEALLGSIRVRYAVPRVSP